MRKIKWLWIVVASLIICFNVSAQAADYPTQDIMGILAWGAGGAGDTIWRGVTPYAEKVLGKNVVCQNKTGGTGSVAMQWVHNRPADGYTLLYHAENPPLYKVLDISQLDYDDFYPISIICRDIGLVVCNIDQPWKNINDLFADAKKRPGQIKMGSTGVGGLCQIASSMFKSISGVSFIETPFQGGGALVAALMGGHVQWSTLGIAAARESVRAGRLRVLGAIADTPVPVAGLENAPLITSVSADYKKFLPWGPFYGIYVKKETPDVVKKTLVDAFKKGMDDPKCQEFLKNAGVVYVGTSGNEASKWIKNWQSATTWFLQDAGTTTFSPAKFGIPRL